MFVDEAKISVKAGKGGDGCVSFRREKYIPKGGPDGGNGGKGGDVLFKAVDNAHTLYDFRRQRLYEAEKGRPGEGNNRSGRFGEDLILSVPVGTQIRDTKTGKILADLVQKNQTAVIARGGIGGKGNAGFVNSVRQAPDFAEKGDLGEEKDLDLELKLVADVALVGYPSVGKSTFISVISNAKPKIADYPFTTLVPNLGMVRVDDRDLIFIDVPGLIEGASEGKGLGHEFLRHIERARYVVHLVDANSDTPFRDYEIIRLELEKFSQDLSHKPFLPVFTKIDLIDDEFQGFLEKEFEKKYEKKPFFVSPVTHQGMDGLLRYVSSQLPVLKQEMQPEVFAQETPEINDTERERDGEDTERVVFKPAQEKKQDEREVKITKEAVWWVLENKRLEQMVRQTPPESESARYRIYDVLKKWNVLKKLEKKGAQKGDLIRIGEQIWEYR